MGTFCIKRKLYTIYDETDNLKRMRDSDILAEQKKEYTGPGAGQGFLKGAAIGGGIAGTVGGLTAGFKDMGKFGSRFKKVGTAGAIIGGLAGAAASSSKISQEKKDIDFYNSRLKFAQNQAKRREAADWKNNMTQRDGYSY